MEPISAQKRLEVLRLYFTGLPYDKIVERTTGVSKGSVVAIVKEGKAGVYPELEAFQDQMEYLRQVAFDLRKSGLSVSQALLGLTLFKQLSEIGVEPSNLKGWVAMCRKLSTPNYPLDRLVDAALRLLTSEEATGMRWDGSSECFLKELGERMSQLKASREQVDELRKEKAGLEAEIGKLGERLSSITNELKQATSAHDGLQKLDMADFARFVADYKALDFDAEQVHELADLKKSLIHMGIKTREIEKYTHLMKEIEMKIMSLTREVAQQERRLRFTRSVSASLSLVEQAIRTGVAHISCFQCGKPVPVPVVGNKTTIGDAIERDLGARSRCDFCGYMNWASAKEILSSLGWLAVPS